MDKDNENPPPSSSSSLYEYPLEESMKESLKRRGTLSGNNLPIQESLTESNTYQLFKKTTETNVASVSSDTTETNVASGSGGILTELNKQLLEEGTLISEAATLTNEAKAVKKPEKETYEAAEASTLTNEAKVVEKPKKPEKETLISEAATLNNEAKALKKPKKPEKETYEAAEASTVTEAVEKPKKPEKLDWSLACVSTERFVFPPNQTRNKSFSGPAKKKKFAGEVKADTKRVAEVSDNSDNNKDEPVEAPMEHAVEAPMKHAAAEVNTKLLILEELKRLRDEHNTYIDTCNKHLKLLNFPSTPDEKHQQMQATETRTTKAKTYEREVVSRMSNKEKLGELLEEVKKEKWRVQEDIFKAKKDLNDEEKQQKQQKQDILNAKKDEEKQKQQKQDKSKNKKKK